MIRNAITTVGAMVMVALFVAPPSALADIYFYSDGVIEDGDVYSEDIGIYDTPPSHTTVNMTGGLVEKRIYTHDESILNPDFPDPTGAFETDWIV